MQFSWLESNLQIGSGVTSSVCYISMNISLRKSSVSHHLWIFDLSKISLWAIDHITLTMSAQGWLPIHCALSCDLIELVHTLLEVDVGGVMDFLKDEDKQEVCTR